VWGGGGGAHGYIVKIICDCNPSVAGISSAVRPYNASARQFISVSASGKLISGTTLSRAEKLVKQGVIRGVMLPKVTCAFDSVKGGVRSAHIIDGRVEHALLLELLTDEGGYD